MKSSQNRILAGALWVLFALVGMLASLYAAADGLAAEGNTPAGDEGPNPPPTPPPSKGAAEVRYEQALEAMQADLANPERSFEFVEAAVAVGDLRGAIAALERILLINPKLANIKLELGVLYLQVGSAQLAQSYLRQALEAPDVPELVRVRAEEMLARAEAAASRHRFSGLLSLAGRYDTNANAAPASVRFVDPIVGGAVEATLQDEFTGREDYSLQALGSFQYGYRLDSQAGNEIEANLLLFGQRYDVSNEVNTTLIDFDLGPRFYFSDIASQDLSLRPYVSVSYLQLDDESYLRTVGGGIGVRNTSPPGCAPRATSRPKTLNSATASSAPRSATARAPKSHSAAP